MAELRQVNRFFEGRHAGILVPLFSIPSRRSWGIGEIPDLLALAGWLDEAGQDVVQLLPLNEMGQGQHSPYSALSALAIDPIFIALADVEDFTALGGEEGAPPGFREALAEVRAAPSIQYDRVRAMKMDALGAAFQRFKTAEWETHGRRATALREYIEQEGWWLDDYALFRSLHASRAGESWMTWPEELRLRDARALAAARAQLADGILFYQYLQWQADEQWQRVRAGAGNVGLFGDLPFMVSGDSADVWARQGDFRLDASVGVPPDAFSETGQDWGLPVYRWRTVARSDYAWLRRRARRAVALYDGYRVDHLVGFYRTYVLPKQGGRRYFTPRDEESQLALGERVMQIFADAGARLVAEDLGTVPDFVRASLARLGIPGYKVLRWEREWETQGQPFRDPRGYPSCSLATTGTHDTEPMAVWWETLPADERARLLAVVPAADRPGDSDFTPAIRDALLDILFSSGSDFLVLPIQDVFGWKDRINTPATVGDQNWTWRLPWPVDDLRAEPEARERASALRGWAGRHGRALEPGTRDEGPGTRERG